MKNNPVIDPETLHRVLEQFRSMDTETLRSTVQRVAQSAGADPRQAQKTAANAEKLKTQFGAMTEEDLRGLLSRIRPQTLTAITEQLRRDGLI